jgi:hypothetical protein
VLGELANLPAECFNADGGSQIGHHQGPETRRSKARKECEERLKHLDIIRATMDFFGGTAKPKLAGRKKRRMSAAGRARIVKAQKARWAKVRAAKVKKAA